MRRRYVTIPIIIYVFTPATTHRLNIVKGVACKNMYQIRFEYRHDKHMYTIVKWAGREEEKEWRNMTVFLRNLFVNDFYLIEFYTAQRWRTRIRLCVGGNSKRDFPNENDRIYRRARRFHRSIPK